MHRKGRRINLHEIMNGHVNEIDDIMKGRDEIFVCVCVLKRTISECENIDENLSAE
jgi:hypothetical protein